MKKILILFASLLFASTAIAENEALYDKQAGSIEIPVLAVKGQPDKSTATLLQQDSERLIFTMTEMIPDASIESSTNEATYNPESGVIVLPMVMVLTEGEPSVETYSMELQQTEESIFEVIQQEKITALPSNATNGIAGDDAEVRMFKSRSGATFRSGGTSTWCSGNPDQNLDTAKQNFKAKCGETWDDQKGHVCDYKSDGYHCNGNRSASASPATSDPSSSTAADTGWCSGTPDRNIDTAKGNFKTGCGMTWNDQLGHVCEWKSDGWHCRGNTSALSAPAAPTSVTATRVHTRVVQIEWRFANRGHISYFDLYRNGEKFASTGSTKRFYPDKQAQGRPTYQVVAVGKNGVRSPSSSVANSASRPQLRGGIRTQEVHSDGDRKIHENGLVTADFNPGGSIVTHHSEITDESGHSLGTVTEEFDGDNINTTTNPTYGPGREFPPQPVGEYPLDIENPGLGYGRPDMTAEFPPQPAIPPPGGDRGDDKPDPPTTTEVDWCQGQTPCL